MLIAISLIAFLVSINAPGDPVERLSKAAGNEGSAEQQSSASKKIKQELRKKLGLDLPVFYISINDLASSDTLYKIPDKYHKSNLKALTHQSGNWNEVSNYYNQLLNFEKEIQSINTKYILDQNLLLSANIVNESVNQLGFEISSLLETSEKEIILIKFKNINELITNNSFLQYLSTSIKLVESSYQNMFLNSTKWKCYIPAINWYGANNQYHLWLFGNDKTRKGLLRGDFGISYIDGQPIQDKIWTAVKWSFGLSLISIFISYLISITIGIYSAYKKDSAVDKGFSLILFILYSMPSFFVGTTIPHI